jgi:3-isopropylmalate/(R)-2-methylmalate dehydratase small subunit
MSNILHGRVWKFGDNIDTDVLAPGIYMKAPLAELAKHCLEAVDPSFAAKVQPGDIVVAGNGFGIGSSREQAAEALKQLGVGAVLAKSFARIFYRNALNLGVAALFCDFTDELSAGDSLKIDPEAGTVENLTTGKTYKTEPIPGHLMAMIRAGGLMPHLKALRAGTASP